uniref:Uncharacterized protein n=1 Tax=Cucumis melo TaxID=3656 RepID=A0A9I9E7R2_CUCME
MDVGPSTSYMHGHRRDRGEHNEYLYYEALAKVSDRQECHNNTEFKVKGDNQLKIDNV